jgi:hypothetical protein
MADFGGIITFSYSGTPLTMRGHVTVGPSNVKATGIPNNDATTSRSFSLTGYTAKMEFEDSTQGANSPATPQPWDAILKGGPYSMTAVEATTGVTHTWTNAKFVGEPEVDRETGQVKGLSIIADKYQILNT